MKNEPINEKQQLEKKTIFGIRPVIEYIKSGKPLSKVLINKNLYKESLNKNNNINKPAEELLKLLKNINVPISKVPKKKLDSLTKKNHQNVIAFISPIYFSKLSDIIQDRYEKAKNPLILILDRIQDAKNLGAIIRTAACIEDVDAIVLPKYEAAQVTNDTIKTSAGAVFNIPICVENNLKNTIGFLKKSGLKIIAVSEKASCNVFEIDYKDPLALILGSEENGIKKEIYDESDCAVKIPISGPIKSLNVSSAAAIVCYEVLRQRYSLLMS